MATNLNCIDKNDSWWTKFTKTQAYLQAGYENEVYCKDVLEDIENIAEEHFEEIESPPVDDKTIDEKIEHIQAAHQQANDTAIGQIFCGMCVVNSTVCAAVACLDGGNTEDESSMSFYLIAGGVALGVAALVGGAAYYCTRPKKSMTQNQDSQPPKQDQVEDSTQASQQKPGVGGSDKVSSVENQTPPTKELTEAMKLTRRWALGFYPQEKTIESDDPYVKMAQSLFNAQHAKTINIKAIETELEQLENPVGEEQKFIKAAAHMLLGFAGKKVFFEAIGGTPTSTEDHFKKAHELGLNESMKKYAGEIIKGLQELKKNTLSGAINTLEENFIGDDKQALKQVNDDKWQVTFGHVKPKTTL